MPGWQAEQSLTLRQRVHRIFEYGLAGEGIAPRVNWALIILVVINVASVVLASVPAIRTPYEPTFLIIELVSVIVFSIEYCARLWASVEDQQFAHMPPWKARLRTMITPAMLVDLLAILPFYIAPFIEGDLRAVLVFRLLRFFKIARYSTGLRSLMDAIAMEKHALAACAGILTGIVLVCASLMQLVEHDAQPDKFGTIPDAMYWAIITLTTVGYGDVFPVTVWGKIIAGLTAVAGLVMLALPVGIVSNAFAEVVHRRDFVVTWGMVARVPIFSDFEASTIAEIIKHLKSQTFEAGEVIVRRGDAARCMYIVASGNVRVEFPNTQVEFGSGDFFGELALVEKVRRSADVYAKSRAHLLVLETSDMAILMERSPDFAAKVKAMAAKRLLGAGKAPEGDFADEEIRAARDNH